MRTYSHLLGSQANQLFRIIRDSGLDPNRFALMAENQAGPSVQILLKEDQHFRFSLVPSEGRASAEGPHSGYWCPGEDTLEDSLEGAEWEDVVDEFAMWVKRINRELEAEDLWAGLEGSAPLPALPPDDNTPFTAKEKKILFQNIDSLLNRVNELHLLNKDQARDFGARLDYLKKAADRVGRKDWLVICYGLVLSHFLEHGISGETARTIFNVVSGTIGNIVALFGHQPTLLQP